MGFVLSVFQGECQKLGLNAPEKLTRGQGAMDWGGEVFLSMSCGGPYRNEFSEHLALLGTLDFGLVEGKAGYYYSKIVGAAHRDIVRLAVNDLGSQSGFHAVYDILRETYGMIEVVISGSHQASMEMIAHDEADFAGIDAQSHRYICEINPRLGEIPVLMETNPTPGLPLVSAQKSEADGLKYALKEAVHAMKGEEILGICGLAEISKAAYLGVENAKSSV